MPGKYKYTVVFEKSWIVSSGLEVKAMLLEPFLTNNYKAVTGKNNKGSLSQASTRMAQKTMQFVRPWHEWEEVFRP
jgi:hypothetical protein